MRAAAGGDALIATAVADALAATGMPFREAHDEVSRNLSGLASLAQKHGVTLDGMLAKKSAYGGTSPERVKEAAERALAKLNEVATS
jgi:argininosuccinate lyase